MLLNRNDVNERVRKIRSKYGVGISQLTENDKENNSSSINLSTPLVSQNRKETAVGGKGKIVKERRIAELEQINYKISRIIY